MREREKSSDFYREEISINRKCQQRIEIRFTEISRKRNREREKRLCYNKKYLNNMLVRLTGTMRKMEQVKQERLKI